MMRAPERIPEACRPAIARPTMTAVKIGAKPQVTTPISKHVIASKKTNLMLKMGVELPDK